ncbi:universal stress protein [Desulfobacterales bacterium HSG17]|nr:universal stress protein [Desulfobacterales bacterium HSG17]
MKNSFIVPLKDSMSSRAVIDYISSLPLSPDNIEITLLHIFRKPSASAHFMGKEFAGEEEARLETFLQNAKDKLIQANIKPGMIHIRLVSEPYPTISDGIIEQFNKGNFNMIVIGRRKKSKSEEFVLEDISVKLVRDIEGAAVLVVKS